MNIAGIWEETITVIFQEFFNFEILIDLKQWN